MTYTELKETMQRDYPGHLILGVTEFFIPEIGWSDACGSVDLVNMLINRPDVSQICLCLLDPDNHKIVHADYACL